MPSVWRWPGISAEHPDRRALHRLLSQWLDIDHHAATKPWSWAAYRHATGWDVNIGIVDDTLTPRLIERSEAHRLHPPRCTGAPRLRQSLQQVAAASWPEIAGGTGTGGWTIQFTTPFTARRGNHFLPWPAPSTVFGSLRATWRTYAAPHVGDLDLDLSLDPIVVTAVDGASTVERVVLRAPRPGNDTAAVVSVGGFLGSVTYAADGKVDTAAVESLVRLAPFCGVGAYTTRGFGAVRVPARR